MVQRKIESMATRMAAQQDEPDGDDPPPLASTFESKVPATTNDGVPVSGSTHVISRKRGRARFGAWASRQVDRRMRPMRPLQAADRIFRIDHAVGSRQLQLPFQPWRTDSFFQELNPNGMCYGGINGTFTCTNNSPIDAGWGRGVAAMINTSTRNDNDAVNSVAFPRDYGPDELEWPYVNFLEHHLRLIMRPGNSSATCRLLVINVWREDSNTAVPKDMNEFTLADFIPIENSAAHASPPMVRPGRGTRGTPAATAATAPPICCFFGAFKPSTMNGWNYKVLADKTWHTSPGDTASRQVPYSFDIRQKQGHVELSIPTGFNAAFYTTRMDGRIIWGLFYEDTDDLTLNPDLDAATEIYNSYYGVYKSKWRLSPP